MTKRLAAIYARVSTEEQAKTSGVPSTDTQVEECRKEAERLDIPVADASTGLIVKETHSGTDILWRGTKFMGLVERAQRHEFTDLFCLNTNRFCRGDMNEMFEQVGYFKHADVTLHFVQDNLPENPGERDLLLAVHAFTNRHQRDSIVEASVRIRTAYAKEGNIIVGNTPPFGWEFVEDPVKKTRRNRPVVIGLKPHPVYGAILLHMYEHVAAGGSIRSLADWLQAQKIPTLHGALTWQPSTIRRMLHNPTNWGERRSFTHVNAPHPEGTRRGISSKRKFLVQRVPEDQQHKVKPEVAHIEPIPGLTRDLAMRTLQRLAQNQEAQSTHAKMVSDVVRAERGLLFGGMVRCGMCKRRGMRVKHNLGGWEYTCDHRATEYEGQTSVSMTTRKLDKAVWGVAVSAVKNPAFFEQVLESTDRIAGPQARAMALTAQLEQAQKEHSNLRKHLARLDPDEPDDQDMIASIESDIREKLTLVRELGKSLDAVLAEQRTEEARQASLTAFQAYAAEARTRLDTMTPLERHETLRAMGVRVRLNGGEESVDKVWIVFDLRGLPGAAEWIRDDMDEHPQHVIDLDADETNRNLPWYVYQLIQTEQGVLFEDAPAEPNRPFTLEEAREAGFNTVEEFERYIEAKVERAERGGAILEEGKEPSAPGYARSPGRALVNTTASDVSASPLPLGGSG